MDETTEPTREKIAQWLAQAEANDWGPEMSTDDQCAVLRLALRTLDAEAQLESCMQVEACSRAFNDLAIRERDTARAKLAAMTERAERAEWLCDFWQCERNEARAKLAERERYIAEQRAITEPSVQDLARQLREATERAEKAERDLADCAASVAHVGESPVMDGGLAENVPASVGLALQRMKARAEKAELERDEEGRLCAERGVLYTNMVRQRDDWHGVAHAAAERAAVSRGLREAAEAERDAVRAKLADAERRVAEVGRELSIKDAHIAEMRRALGEQHAKLSNMHRRAQRAENPTTHTRCEAIFQRKRADWWRSEAKRLGWTPDYPELRKDPPSDARIDCESSSMLLLSTWARRVMMREKNRDKGVPSESVEELIAMAREELFEASDAIHAGAPTDYILAELGDAAAIIGFAMREIEKRRKA